MLQTFVVCVTDGYKHWWKVLEMVISHDYKQFIDLLHSVTIYNNNPVFTLPKLFINGPLR